jgi:lipoprotein-anchoring transpeptidase ErfK/SrfK
MMACSADPTAREEGVPFRYFLVSNAVGDLQKGFGVAEAELQRDRIRTRSGRVVPLENLEEAKPAHSLAVEKFGSAWVVEAKAGVWSRPDDTERPIAQKAHLDHVALDNRAAPPGWIATREGYMRASELRMPTHAERPLEVAPGERWIDVDTNAEVLTVYDGDQPRLITVIATGNGRPGTRFSTPRGLFHINYKVPHATMDNVDEGGDPAYSFEEVPWVQYFHKEVALHGAYWHSRFGHAISHGCVNLAPADAQRVYAMTRASTPAYAGTVVRVR